MVGMVDMVTCTVGFKCLRSSHACHDRRVFRYGIQWGDKQVVGWVGFLCMSKGGFASACTLAANSHLYPSSMLAEGPRLASRTTAREMVFGDVSGWGSNSCNGGVLSAELEACEMWEWLI